MNKSFPIIRPLCLLNWSYPNPCSISRFCFDFTEYTDGMKYFIQFSEFDLLSLPLSLSLSHPSVLNSRLKMPPPPAGLLS